MMCNSYSVNCFYGNFTWFIFYIQKRFLVKTLCMVIYIAFIISSEIAKQHDQAMTKLWSIQCSGNTHLIPFKNIISLLLNTLLLCINTEPSVNSLSVNNVAFIVSLYCVLYKRLINRSILLNVKILFNKNITRLLCRDFQCFCSSLMFWTRVMTNFIQLCAH